MAQGIAQLLAADEFHGDERHAVGIPDLVNHSDVRMLERRCGTGFVEKPLAAGWIVNEFGGSTLSATSRPSGCLHRAKDDAHAAAADLFDDFVVGESLTDHPFNIKNQERAASAARQRQSRGADQPPPRLRRSAEASAKAEAPRCW